MNYLRLFVELFRFIKRYRERELQRLAYEANERKLEREHQRLLVEGIFQRIVDLAQTMNVGVVEIAKAQMAQAASFQQWLDGFKIQDPSPAVPTSPDSVERQAWLEENGFPTDLPPEFQLAYTLKELESMNNNALATEGFDREGRDTF